MSTQQGRFWLKSYPGGVPHDIDWNQYGSLVDLIEEAFTRYRDRSAYVGFGTTLSFADLDRLSRHREALRLLFAQDLPDPVKLERRQQIFDQMRSDYSLLRERWGGFAGYDAWFAQPLSTPRLAAVATYSELVPAIYALLARHGVDIVRFNRAAAELAQLPTDERRAAIVELHPGLRAGR